MATTLVVDGYNAINAIPEIKNLVGAYDYSPLPKKGLLAARKAVLALCREYARSSGYITDVKVVFDGKDQYRGLEGLVIPRERGEIFSDTDSGDDKIIETIRKCSRLGKVVVASNDNYVRNNARAYGAATIFSQELVRKKPACRSGREKKSQDKKQDGKVIGHDLANKITREYKKELGL